MSGTAGTAQIIVIGPMWGGLVDWARTYMLRPRFELEGGGHGAIPLCVNSADEAIAVIRERHAEWRTTVEESL